MPRRRLPVATPPLVLLGAEAPRWAFEYLHFLGAQVTLRSGPRGDGRTTLVIPGLGADNSSTAPLRWLLGQMGHDARPWLSGHNLGKASQYEETVELVISLASDRPVNIVGHSLGGMYARLVARQFPELVNRVLTLGSPFLLQPWDRTAVTTLGCIASAVPVESLALWQSEEDLPPLLVPATAIYSLTDGVVRPSLCHRDDEDSVLVSSSHTGMIHSPGALAVVLERLAA